MCWIKPPALLDGRVGIDAIAMNKDRGRHRPPIAAMEGGRIGGLPSLVPVQPPILNCGPARLQIAAERRIAGAQQPDLGGLIRCGRQGAPCRKAATEAVLPRSDGHPLCETARRRGAAIGHVAYSWFWVLAHGWQFLCKCSFRFTTMRKTDP